MADHDTAVVDFELGTHWRHLIDDWAGREALHHVQDGDSVTLEFDIPDTGRALTVRFMTTSRLLVGFMTDGHFLERDQLAMAAAAANAWNTEQLIPMLSVWDVRGPRPCLAGVCTLPLGCRMTGSGFAATAGGWVAQGRLMFTRCRQVFKL